MDNMTQVGKKIGVNTLISWGASVVIVGLTFKILHWPGGEWMIGVGLLVEAVLFFLMGYAAMSERAEKPATVVHQQQVNPHIQNFNDMLASSIDPHTIEKLRASFDNFNRTVDSVNSVTGAEKTTRHMITEIEHATIEIQQLRKNLAELNTIYKAQLEAFRK